MVGDVLKFTLMVHRDETKMLNAKPQNVAIYGHQGQEGIPKLIYFGLW